MGSVSTPLIERAQTIFDELGYTVSGDGREFRAERAWKVVRVTTVGDPVDAPTDGEFWCFVTDRAVAPRLERELDRMDPGYEWAIMSIDDDDYRIERAPPAHLTA